MVDKREKQEKQGNQRRREKQEKQWNQRTRGNHIIKRNQKNQGVQRNQKEIESMLSELVTVNVCLL